MSIVNLIIILLAAAVPIVCLISAISGERNFYKKLWEDQFNFNAKLFRELMQYKNGEGWKNEL